MITYRCILLCYRGVAVRGYSQWSPPTGHQAPPGTTPTLPFTVQRSKYRNLPVYTEYKSGRSQVLTRVTKVNGDVQELERLLRRHIETSVGGVIRSRVDEVTGSVSLVGNHRDSVVTLLKDLGF